MGNPQQLSRGRIDRQHRLQQKALVPAVADGTQAAGLAMGLIIQLRRILYQQHHRLLLTLLPRLLHMRTQQCFITDLRTLQEPIGGFHLLRLAELLGQRDIRLSRDGLRQADRTTRPSLISQPHLSKGRLRPRLWRHHRTPFQHLSLLSFHTPFSILSLLHSNNVGTSQDKHQAPTLPHIRPLSLQDPIRSSRFIRVTVQTVKDNSSKLNLALCFNGTTGGQEIIPVDASGNNGYSEVEVWATTGPQYSNNTCVNKIMVPQTMPQAVL